MRLCNPVRITLVVLAAAAVVATLVDDFELVWTGVGAAVTAGIVVAIMERRQRRDTRTPPGDRRGRS